MNKRQPVMNASREQGSTPFQWLITGVLLLVICTCAITNLVIELNHKKVEPKLDPKPEPFIITFTETCKDGLRVQYRSEHRLALSDVCQPLPKEN